MFKRLSEKTEVVICALPGFTLLFEALLLQLCKVMPVHNVSQLTGVSGYKIWRTLDIYIERSRKDEDFSEINTLGIKWSNKAELLFR